MALDHFPFNGYITTCEALWTGVPVINWANSSGHDFGRVGLSLLTRVGLPELIVNTQIGVDSQFLGQSEPTAHFGMDKGSEPIAEIRIQWPDGTEKVLTQVERRQTLVVRAD